MEEKKKCGTTAYRGKWFLPILFSLVFALCMIFGRCLDRDGSVPFTHFGLWICVLLLTAGGAFLTRFVWNLLLKSDVKREKKETEVTGKTFLLTALILFLCYLPVFLAVYPGFFVYDAQDELMQVVTRSFSTHHPLAHVLMLGGIIQLVHKVSGSYNLGIACYTLFQMMALSCIFVYGICHLRKEGMGKRKGILMTLYLGLFPTIVMFVLCSAKDGLFTGMLFLLVLMIRKLVKDPEGFFKEKKYVLLFAGSALLMMLFRHNGFYAFLVFAFLFLGLHKVMGLTGYLKKTVLVFAGILAAYLILNKGLAFALQAQDAGSREMLTVPIQQMTRVYAMEGDSLSEEEKNTLFEILPEEALSHYTPKVSDPVMIAFDNEAYEKDPGKYLKLWVQIGMKHPFAYLNAWFMTSYGFWYPDTVIDVYRGNTVFTFTYGDSSYFGYEVEQPGERHSFFPALDAFYRWLSLDPTIQKIPVIRWLFSPGALFWVILFFLSYFCYSGQEKKAVPYLIAVVTWLTVILGPTYLVRYVVFLWVLLPVLLWDLKSGDLRPGCAENPAFDN